MDTRSIEGEGTHAMRGFEAHTAGAGNEGHEKVPRYVGFRCHQAQHPADQRPKRYRGSAYCPAYLGQGCTPLAQRHTIAMPLQKAGDRNPVEIDTGVVPRCTAHGLVSRDGELCHPSPIPGSVHRRAGGTYIQGSRPEPHKNYKQDREEKP